MELLFNFAEFVWYTFILGFCSHLPILAAYLIMVLFICGRIGRGLGVPLLIWDQRLGKRYFSGLALSLFFAKLFVVGFLLTEGLRAEAIRNAQTAAPESTGLFQSKWVEPVWPPAFAPPADAPASIRFRDRIFTYFGYMTVILLGVMGIIRVFGRFQGSQFRSRFRVRPPALT